MRARTFNLYWTVSRQSGRRGLEVKLRRFKEEIAVTDAGNGEVLVLFEKSRTEMTAFPLVRKPDATYERGPFDDSSTLFINKSGKTLFVVSDVSEGDRVVSDMRKGRFENLPSPMQCSVK